MGGNSPSGTFPGGNLPGGNLPGGNFPNTNRIYSSSNPCENIFSEIIKYNKRSIILGDFNSHSEFFGSSKNTKSGEKLETIIFENNYHHV